MFFRSVHLMHYTIKNDKQMMLYLGRLSFLFVTLKIEGFSWNTQEKVSRAIQNIAYFVMQAEHAPRDGAVGTGTRLRVPVGQYLLSSSQLRPAY